eukprot:Gregarina_sp_Poly_1__5428@NODE_2868_length_1612_cov_227_714563_g1810_i0_p2_GENE_NODE_2868_length_1612_cov_227_714563_g1810_i0NODE_2868_length_1612_cov_227_714563_g1810_i0_p2_ORF_typecomplete_len236_score52_51SRP40_C/PF05022_12/1_8e04SRP40_C/PF05022_12/5_9e19UPF0561/PF10573_9/19_NODE_2868_length_1612_cov_227_714563_g1810_i0136843
MGGVKRSKSDSSVALGPAVAKALFHYLHTDLNLRKTSKYFKKETKQLIQWDEDASVVDFQLAPLFQRIEDEYANETKRRKVHSESTGKPASKRKSKVKNKNISKVEETPTKTDYEVHPPSSSDGKTESAHDDNSSSSSPNGLLTKKERKSFKKECVAAGPLQRIDTDFWKSRAAIKDNSFWAKGGDDFASKAAAELIRVKGRDFRHEKAKKKKASWRGCGAIDMGVNSIVFEDSD